MVAHQGGHMAKIKGLDNVQIPRNPKIADEEMEFDITPDDEELEDYKDHLEKYSRDPFYDLYQVEHLDSHFLLSFRDIR
jgi:hypothetical protein